jgi:lipoprotein signal peptidase
LSCRKLKFCFRSFKRFMIFSGEYWIWPLMNVVDLVIEFSTIKLNFKMFLSN